MFKICINGKEKILDWSHDIYDYIKEVLQIDKNLDLLHDIQWFCANADVGDTYGSNNRFIIERISW